MSLVQIDELEQSISARASAAVIHKLFIELDRLAKRDEINDEWFEDVFEAYKFIVGIETGFTLAKAYALYLIKKNWMQLPYDIRRNYGFEYLNFAQLVTGKEISTINNYTRTAEIWVEKGVSPGHAIKVVDRDEKDRPLNTTHYEDFSPYRIDMSKLLVLNARADKGEMTEGDWERLMDDTVSCGDIQKFLRDKTNPSGEPASYWYCEADWLVYKHNLDRIPVAQINFAEYETDNNVREAIDRLLSILNIKLDEKYLYEMFKKEFTINGQNKRFNRSTVW